MILKKDSVYVHSRDDMRTWVPWFDISNHTLSIGRPSVGEVLVYLGRGSEIVKGRGLNASPNTWCFLRGTTIAEVYNSSFVYGLDEVEE